MAKHPHPPATDERTAQTTLGTPDADTRDAAPPAVNTDPPPADARDIEIALLKQQVADLQQDQAAGTAPADDSWRNVSATAQAAVALPTRKLYYIAGPWHICGRSSPATRFVPDDATDRRPHAFVHQAFGDHLIENDREVDPKTGTVGPARYAWAPDYV